MDWTYDDGGRRKYFKAENVSDCACRAIATGIPYQQVHDDINRLAKQERITKQKKDRSSARNGVYKATLDKLMREYGWKWKPTMSIIKENTYELVDFDRMELHPVVVMSY